ncbi:TPA: TIGR03745 family integrating conjugative element membrane protein [Enterobacter kobei]|nr:TIGR03745 family integrating conjugative element membrane protein [Enterobacter kobei]
MKCRTPSSVIQAAFALIMTHIPISAFSAQGLQKMEDPLRSQGSGILQTLQNYSYDIVMLIALLVVASMFLGVCYHAYTRYFEIHTVRATWGQFGLLGDHDFALTGFVQKSAALIGLAQQSLPSGWLAFTC